MDRATTKRIPTDLSLYLDLLRFLAAVAVFISHITTYPFGTQSDDVRHGWERIGNYGQFGVVIFFVLSGYVIAYVTSTRERDWASYVVSRCSRLYSVIMPALVLTFVCDRIGQSLAPDFYTIGKVMLKPPSIEGYLSSLFYVNEYRVFSFGGIAPGSNGPFWSLSFEGTYYAVAGLMLYLRPRIAFPLVIVLLALAGPSIAAMLPIWGLGYALFHIQDRVAAGIRWPASVLVLSASALALMPYSHLTFTGASLGIGFPAGRGQGLLDLGKDYATAIIFSIHLLAAKRLFDLTPGIIQRIPLKVGTIRFLGATTFPLYAIHFPLLAVAAAISPFAIGSSARILFLCAIVAIGTAVLTPFCDWLKDALRAPLLSVARRWQST